MQNKVAKPKAMDQLPRLLFFLQHNFKLLSENYGIKDQAKIENIQGKVLINCIFILIAWISVRIKSPC